MHIRVKGLSAGVNRQYCEEPAAALGFADQQFFFSKPIGAHFTLEKVGEQIVCLARVSASMEMECSRCLDPVEVKICEQMTLLLTFSRMSLPSPVSEEVKVIAPDVEVVDVSEEVRQTILLALPIKPLCSEDCKGLCPQCGVNLNVSKCRCQRKAGDPRWSGLQQLLSNKSKGERSGRS